MSRHAIVDKDNVVVNVIVWEGGEFLPPRNHTVVHCDKFGCDIGDLYHPETNTFTKFYNRPGYVTPQ